jgi:Zn-dependent peptidase ImmA (M78 family)/DNA-binding XRE family transcriptional regulator
MFGERIRQARLLAGMSQEQLADKLAERNYKITKQAISKYENNQSMAPAQFLLLAASILDVPNSYFSHEPKIAIEWLAFRRQSSFPVREQETVKNYAADVAELYLDLESLLYPQVAKKDKLPERQRVSTFEQAEKVAETLREAWELDNHPIDSLVRTAEDHLVIVITWDKDGGRFDGLSGRIGDAAVTVISSDVSADRRRFSLGHELGHLLMDTQDVSEKESEYLAHRFAAALLVPADRAFHELGTRRTQLDFEELAILKRKYGLSMAAWLIRARDLGIITQNYYGQLQIEISKNGWRKQEPPVDYIGDEVPLKIEQMAHHAVAEGLISSDRIRRVYPQWKETVTVQNEPKRFTIYDLMALPQEEQERVMAKAFELAAQEDFEIFEADELYDYTEDSL